MRDREKQIMSGFVKIGKVLRDMPSASPRLYHLSFSGCQGSRRKQPSRIMKKAARFSLWTTSAKKSKKQSLYRVSNSLNGSDRKLRACKCVRVIACV